jgi:hypothetical protein
MDGPLSPSTPSPKFLGYLGRYMPDCYYPKNLWNGALDERWLDDSIKLFRITVSMGRACAPPPQKST